MTHSRNRTDGRQRIVWKPHEIEIIIKEAAMMFFLVPTTTPLQALKHAETFLDEDRRRNLNRIHPIRDWFVPEVKKRLQLIQDAQNRINKRAVEEPIPKPVPPPPPPPPKEEEPVIQEPPEIPIQPVREPSFLSEILAYTRAQLVSEFAAILRDALKEAGTLKNIEPVSAPIATAASEAHRPYVLNTPKTPKLRILIVGLLGSQENEIKNIFGEAFDLRFKSAEDNTTSIAQQAKGADHTYSMVGYMSHQTDGAVYRALKKLNAHDKYHRINGSLSDLRTVLRGQLHDYQKNHEKIRTSLLR